MAINITWINCLLISENQSRPFHMVTSISPRKIQFDGIYIQLYESKIKYEENLDLSMKQNHSVITLSSCKELKYFYSELMYLKMSMNFARCYFGSSFLFRSRGENEAPPMFTSLNLLLYFYVYIFYQNVSIYSKVMPFRRTKCSVSCVIISNIILHFKLLQFAFDAMW